MNPSHANIEPHTGCISKALAVVGDKWSPLILREIAEGTHRFSILARHLVGISPRTLSQRLDHLEQAGILRKECFSEMPPRIEYTLTAKGADLLPILRQMAKWGDKY